MTHHKCENCGRWKTKKLRVEKARWGVKSEKQTSLEFTSLYWPNKKNSNATRFTSWTAGRLLLIQLAFRLQVHTLNSKKTSNLKKFKNWKALLFFWKLLSLVMNLVFFVWRFWIKRKGEPTKIVWMRKWNELFSHPTKMSWFKFIVWFYACLLFFEIDTYFTKFDLSRSCLNDKIVF